MGSLFTWSALGIQEHPAHVHWREAVVPAVWSGLQDTYGGCLSPNFRGVPINVEDYREELMISLSSARELTATTIQKAQSRYKGNYD